MRLHPIQADLIPWPFWYGSTPVYVLVSFNDLDLLSLTQVDLASVQATTLQFSFPNNSTRLEIATNALAFAGLILDILGAAGCLYVSATLRSAPLGLGYIADIQAVLSTSYEDSSRIGLKRATTFWRCDPSL